MVETLGPLQGKHEVFKEGALVKRPLTAFDFDTILLEVAGILQGNKEGEVLHMLHLILTDILHSVNFTRSSTCQQPS